VVIFVIWAGIRGIARVAVFKDFAMLVALLVVLAGIIAGVGGIPDVFARVGAAAPRLMTVSTPGLDTTFFVTSAVVTSIGAGLNTFPHLWPPILAAKSGAVLRSNYSWLPVYQLLLFVPILAGMAGFLVLKPKTPGNNVLLTVAQQTLPEWLVAVIAVAGAAAAMVPAAAIAMGISSLVSHNVLSVKSPVLRFRLNHVVVVVAVGLALLFGLAKSDIASPLLLTYGGLTQLAPAVALALPRRAAAGAVPVLLGVLVGTLSVAAFTFAKVPLGGWDSGLVSLAPNLLVLAVAEALRRRRPCSEGDEVTARGQNLLNI
jgi:SSS family solute:Na+ symporter